MRTFLALLALVLLWLAPCRAADRPNFLIILTDDHGQGDVSSYFAKDLETPHIDRLASEGMLFHGVRANATVCSPSRAALLTGRYPDRAGVPGVIRTAPTDSWGYLAPGIPTLPEKLAEVGYHTALVGKWHLGLEHPNTPNHRGFAHFHGFLGDMMDSYTDHRRHGINYMRRNTAVIDPPGHATDLFADWAVQYLEDRAGKPGTPFFLLLAFNAPHFPIEPPPDWLDRVRRRAPGMEERRARNIAFVEHLDDRIGRVLDALDRLDLARETLVVFTADNGGSLPHAQSNGPWRGGKQDHYDGGLRVPFIVRWPGHVPEGTRSHHAGLVFDLFPTLLGFAGAAPVPETDALSLAPALEGREAEKTRDLYFVRREGGTRYGGKTYEALVRGDWKLMQNDPWSPMELYNLRDDPGERVDRAATETRMLNELSAALRVHIQRGGRIPWQPSVPARP